MSGVTDKLSGTAFRLQTFRDTIPLGTATGFVYRATDNSIWLVTNYHVLSGYNPLTMQPLTCSPGDPSVDMRVRHQETDEEEESVQRGADHRGAA